MRTVALKGSGGRLLHINGTFKRNLTIRDSKNHVLIELGPRVKTAEIPDNATSISFNGTLTHLRTQEHNLSPRMEMYDDILEYREQHGLRNLKVNYRLMEAAQFHSQEMWNMNTFEHSTQGIHRGENIAAGYGSSDAAMRAFINSPPHNKNLLFPGYREIGIGYVDAASNNPLNYHYYWTQQFL